MNTTKQQTQTPHDVQNVRCNLGHSGNTTLHQTVQGWYECAGCGALHSTDAVRQTQSRPVTGITGAGGLARVA